MLMFFTLSGSFVYMTRAEDFSADANIALSLRWHLTRVSDLMMCKLLARGHAYEIFMTSDKTL